MGAAKKLPKREAIITQLVNKSAAADLKAMAEAMPDCRLVTIPGIGHSMNLELPALYAGYFGAWFGGLKGQA